MLKKELKSETNEPYIICEYFQDKQYLYSNWIGSYLPVEKIKQGTLLVLEMIKEHSATKLINDNRELEGVWDEANEFIEKVWMPQAIEAGLKRFAHILSPNLYAQLSAEFMEDNAKKIENIFALKMFGDFESAEKWVSE